MRLTALEKAQASLPKKRRFHGVADKGSSHQFGHNSQRVSKLAHGDNETMKEDAADFSKLESERRALSGYLGHAAGHVAKNLSSDSV
jgi:hypothetical protein